MVKINKAELTQMVNSGAKKEEIASKYQLTMAATGRLLKQAGLKLKKTHKPTFELVDDTPVVTTDSQETSVINVQ